MDEVTLSSDELEHLILETKHDLEAMLAELQPYLDAMDNQKRRLTSLYGLRNQAINRERAIVEKRSLAENMCHIDGAPTLAYLLESRGNGDENATLADYDWFSNTGRVLSKISVSFSFTTPQVENLSKWLGDQGVLLLGGYSYMPNQCMATTTLVRFRDVRFYVDTLGLVMPTRASACYTRETLSGRYRSELNHLRWRPTTKIYGVRKKTKRS